MESQEKYKRIFENIQDIYFEADIQGRFLEISPSVEKILGYSRDELKNTLMRQIYGTKTNLFTFMKESGGLSDFEILIKNKAGETLVCSINARLLNNESGPRVIGSIRDISKRKQAEKKLQEGEELYRTLAEKSFAGVYVVQNGRFCFVNSNAASYAGYKVAEIIGRDSLSVVHPDDVQVVLQNAKDMLSGKRSAPYEFRIITKTGQVRWIMETVAPITYEGAPAVLGNSMDTSWTLSRVDLEIVQAIIESVQDGVFIVDIHGNYVTSNAGFERISGINRNEMIGKHTKYLVEKKYVKDVVNLEVLKDLKPKSKMITYPSQKEILVSADLVWDKNKCVVGAVSSMRDLTELNKIHKQLIHSNVLINKYKKRLDLLESHLHSSELKVIAESTESRRLNFLAEKVAKSDVTVLITGESGVGKEVIAKYIHENSERKLKGFVKVDCAAIPSNLLESELFGYEKGSFTDANKEGKRGLFEIANKGTLFLDEIGDLPLELQSKLLTAIQDREIKRIGGLNSLSIDVRILAATNKDLEEMVREKKFRNDLYYRLKVVPLHIPPLRKRRADIMPLVMHFVDEFNKVYKSHKYLRNESIKHFLEYDWPGNIRELKNMIERLIIMTSGDEIGVDYVVNEIKNYNDLTTIKTELKQSEKVEKIGPLKELVKSYEREIINMAIKSYGNLHDAAKALEIDISTLTRKKRR